MPSLSDSNATNSNDESLSQDTINQAGVEGTITVGTSAVEAKVGVSRHANRRMLTVIPLDNGVYWGFTSSVTTSTGTPIDKNTLLSFRISDYPVYLIAGTAGNEVRITEA